MMRAWILPMLFVLSGSAVAAALAFRGSPGEAAALLPAFVLIAGANSPLVFPRSIGALEAQRRSAADGRPVVYWRPGCKYCLRLRIRLGRGARQLHWVDVWHDPAGAAAVREANGGDETVPTVVVAGRPHTNPDPAWVREQLPPSAEAGHGGVPPRGHQAAGMGSAA
ncbi:glutaredoxin domain-containing protein [Streptomyces echinatus]|uniref:glutaredoxin domain-containing protein n=1 Tax=Streptomyces echinatus TaxID=67293 RepID=UPI0037AF94F5